jgi:hypothetical protein
MGQMELVLVEVVKIKKDKPTVIKIGQDTYILRPEGR